jgi:hypothetical protein
MGTKTVTVNGKDVDVDHELKTDQDTGLCCVELTARVGQTTVRHRMTVGSIDQAIPSTYDDAELALDLEESRQHVAALAESRERIRNMIPKHLE